MSDYPMLISNKLHSFRNFMLQRYDFLLKVRAIGGYFLLKVRAISGWFLLKVRAIGGHFC